MLLYTVAARDEIVDDRDGNQDNSPDHAEGGQFSDLAVFPELKDGDGNHRGLRGGDRIDIESSLAESRKTKPSRLGKMASAMAA